MLCFKEFSIEDKVWMDELFAYSDSMATDFCFTTLFLWRHTYEITICRYKDALLARSVTDGEPYYMFPQGRVTDSILCEVMELLSADARDNFGAELMLFSVLDSSKEWLERVMPNIFSFERERDTDDYIYKAIDLLTLRGKRLQSKRNHLARFIELPNWSFEPITSANLAECIVMNSEWCEQYLYSADGSLQNRLPHSGSVESGSEEDCSKQEEALYTKECLERFSELKLLGGLLRLDGRVIAFSIGEILNSNTFIVHIEKAFATIRGAYPAISREFLRSVTAEPIEYILPNGDANLEITTSQIGFEYVSREDDAGDENLRRAKMQYNPLFLLEKWIAIAKEK